MAENKKVFVGYTEFPRLTQKFSLTLEEIETLKQYATEKSGRVFLTLVCNPHKTDNKRLNKWLEVYDPNAPQEQSRKLAAETTSGNEVPF
tara:strand:+ start:1076 stop:1345 length:270 start_codon:yes stop_codon:yes gene_type:complete